VKKGIVVLLILLAVIVLVSPAIVGRLAEQSMDENLNWAARETGGVSVSSESFTRGWFSSEGRHRIEVGEGPLLAALEDLGHGADPDELPALIINTKLDHGLIPVSSMAREKGSLAPGLGSAVSTMQLELPDGEILDLPGTIYSKVSLGGQLESNYLLPAGSYPVDDMTATWGDMDITVITDPVSGEASFDGTIGALAIGNDTDGLSLASLNFDGKQKPTPHGFATGDVRFALADLSVRTGGVDTATVKSMSVRADTNLDDDRVHADATISMTMQQLPQYGEMSFDMSFALVGADAAALGRIQQGLETAQTTTQDPMVMYGMIEKDLMQLFASGFDMNFERLEITLPEGTVTSKMLFSFPESDAATFEWTSLLLGTEASVDLSIPAELVETVGQSNPQLAAAIGGGFLTLRGDVYVMEARLKKGLATVNGAPIPIPVGSM
jgi:uncharacterized protein YdgA (DUF945 family)